MLKPQLMPEQSNCRDPENINDGHERTNEFYHSYKDDKSPWVVIDLLHNFVIHRLTLMPRMDPYFRYRVRNIQVSFSFLTHYYVSYYS